MTMEDRVSQGRIMDFMMVCIPVSLRCRVVKKSMPEILSVFCLVFHGGSRESRKEVRYYYD